MGRWPRLAVVLAALAAPGAACKGEAPPASPAAAAPPGEAAAARAGADGLPAPATVPDVRPARNVVACETLLQRLCAAAGEELCAELRRRKLEQPPTEHDVRECEALLADAKRLQGTLELLEAAAAKRLAVKLQADRAAQGTVPGGIATVPGEGAPEPDIAPQGDATAPR